MGALDKEVTTVPRLPSFRHFEAARTAPAAGSLSLRYHFVFSSHGQDRP